MRTTIELPDELYRAAKIRAVEANMSLKDLVTRSLQRELNEVDRVCEAQAPYWSHRSLAPSFAQMKKEGILRGGTDSAQIVSEERTSREDSVS